VTNILAIGTSPRPHSNSTALLDVFIDRYATLDDALRIVRKQVHGMRIGWCRACDACKRFGNGCVQKDDMTVLYPLVKGATIIVLATPVYWWGISAQAKTFIDRLYALDHSDFAGKHLVLLATGADEETGVQYRLIKEQFAEICSYLSIDFAGYAGVSAEDGRTAMANQVARNSVETLADRLHARLN